MYSSKCIINPTEKKGYDDGFFAWAFLFGTLYLIYSAGLPLKKDDYEITINNSNNEDLNHEESNYFTKCPKCGFPVYKDEKCCSYCKNPNNQYKKD